MRWPATAAIASAACLRGGHWRGPGRRRNARPPYVAPAVRSSPAAEREGGLHFHAFAYRFPDVADGKAESRIGIELKALEAGMKQGAVDGQAAVEQSCFHAQFPGIRRFRSEMALVDEVAVGIAESHRFLV